MGKNLLTFSTIVELFKKKKENNENNDKRTNLYKRA